MQKSQKKQRSAFIVGALRRVQRWWFPALGGQRWCTQYGFLTAMRVWLDPDTGEEKSASDVEIRTPERNSIRRGTPLSCDSLAFFQCYRDAWSASYSQEVAKAGQHLRCRLFFPYQSAVMPAAHLQLKREVGNRWWAFWTVLAATGLGGAISGIILAMVK